MGDNSVMRTFVLSVGVFMTFVLIVSGIALLSGKCAVTEEETVAIEETTETETTTETAPTVAEQTTAIEATTEATQDFNQVKNTLVASNVLMVLMSILAMINGVTLFLIYRFLKHSQKLKYSEYKEISGGTLETFPEYLASGVYRLHDYLYHEDEA